MLWESKDQVTDSRTNLWNINRQLVANVERIPRKGSRRGLDLHGCMVLQGWGQVDGGEEEMDLHATYYGPVRFHFLSKILLLLLRHSFFLESSPFFQLQTYRPVVHLVATSGACSDQSVSSPSSPSSSSSPSNSPSHFSAFLQCPCREDCCPLPW